MHVDLAIFLILLIEWLLYSVSLYSVSGKLKFRKRSYAWIPGLRQFALGDSVGMGREGSFCGLFDIIFMAAAIVRILLQSGRIGVALALLTLVMYVFYYIYRLKIYIRVLRKFDLPNKWVALWLIAGWLSFMLLGFGKKYQPVVDFQDEEHVLGGTAPAEIAALDTKERKVHLVNEGLSVDLRERSVREHRKKRYLLKNMALNIPTGSLVLLLGGSGAGKTTFVNALIGYEKADATVLLNGADVYKDYKSVKHKIGFVQQKNLMRGKDTVINTINDAAMLRLPKSVTKAERIKKMDEIMDLLGLSAGKEGLVEKKSGGQLRRISIALELVTDPDLLILDEPDSGLDGVIAREIFMRLRDIADEGRIVIVITHTPDRVIDLFDKVIVLARDSGRVGRLAFYGSPDEAREFFGRETMERIVMSVNSADEGGEGKADEYITRFAEYVNSEEAGEAS